MSPHDLREFTRKRPFSPFRIHVSDGRTYDIRRPDQAIPLQSRVVIGVGGDLPDHLEHISLFHLVRLEELEPQTSEGSG